VAHYGIHQGALAATELSEDSHIEAIRGETSQQITHLLLKMLIAPLPCHSDEVAEGVGEVQLQPLIRTKAARWGVRFGHWRPPQ
jgi:hypothetical protein